MDDRAHSAARRVQGRSAAPGIALGPLVRLAAAKHDCRQHRSVAEEHQALVDALTDADDAILDGGVRYLAGWTFVKTRGPDLAAVPPSLREVLLSRAESSGDGDKIQRARRAFA